MAIHYYIDATTRRFKGVFDKTQTDPNLISVPGKPPGKNYKYENDQWVALSTEEVEKIEDVYEPNEIVIKDIDTPFKTTLNAIAIWGNTEGSKLLNSAIKIVKNILEIPYSINLEENETYRIDGRNILERDRKEELDNDSDNTNSRNDSELVSLTSENESTAKFDICFDGMFWVNRNNKTVNIGLWIGDEEQEDYSLNPRFSRANDHKMYRITARSVTLKPDTEVSIRWSVDNSNTRLYCNRKQLFIEEVRSIRNG